MFSLPIISFILNYGYLAILVGSFFEGETVLVIGGLAAQQGYLELTWVFLASLVGTVLSDNTFFFLGRYKGYYLTNKYRFFKKLGDFSEKINGKSGPLLSFGMRFMYGFRHLTPFSLGLSSISKKDFFFFNFLGGVVWVLIIGFAGYFFGDLLEILLGKIRHYEFRVIVVAIIAVVFGNVFYKIIRKGFKMYLR